MWIHTKTHTHTLYMYIIFAGRLEFVFRVIYPQKGGSYVYVYIYIRIALNLNVGEGFFFKTKNVYCFRLLDI